MYILLTDENTVAEIIPDENPIFPGISIEERYAPDFVAKLMHFADDTEVQQNWLYDPETQSFSEPPKSEPMPEPEPVPEPEPTEVEKLQAEVARLKAQNELQAQQQSFLEDCLLEMGNIVYA